MRLSTPLRTMRTPTLDSTETETDVDSGNRCSLPSHSVRMLKAPLSRWNRTYRHMGTLLAGISGRGDLDVTDDAFRFRRRSRIRSPQRLQDDKEAPFSDSAEVERDATHHENRAPHRRRWATVVALLILMREAFPPRTNHPKPRCVGSANFVLQAEHRTYSHGDKLYPQAARTTFKFLSSSRTLTFDALGTQGSIRFVLDNDTGFQDHADMASERHITVDVTAFSDDWLAFEQAATICQTAPHLTEAGYVSEGVVISTQNTDRSARNRTAFDITVHQPAPSWTTSPPLLLPNISATMFSFDFLVDMDDRVRFDSVFLKSMDRNIRINSLHANSVRVQNWNGGISGSFKSAHQIDLYAHNGAVTINADLVANESSVIPTLLVTTVYGPVEASVNLLARSMTELLEGVEPPRYKTMFHTSNAPLSVTYPVAPESHNLTLSASNSHARSTVRLPDSFVGALTLRSHSQHRPPIVHLDEEKDRHKRSMQVTYMSEHLMTVMVSRNDLGHPLGGGLVDVQMIDSDLDLLL
ncbi:uncharacterized protein B0H18DRAFT_983584 [Fomitopsis serialis]|uniref:uncharacterized protein n=1 Tax=Fomitopsis serialis TaxID=139415 RepID=UPI00200763D1|nr:uncharacterized protein B0H18DRAFT_983584 [Neoantrodia serialis]KAH9933416.1 hypothetical protein B0H18DRAFT_983584 [Neoantrodia serialis]